MDRDSVKRLWQEWQDAEKAYREESARYVSGAWEGQPMEWPEKVLTSDAMQQLRAMRQAASEAQERFEAAVGKS